MKRKRNGTAVGAISKEASLCLHYHNIHLKKSKVQDVSKPMIKTKQKTGEIMIDMPIFAVNPVNQ